jgi:hypothetical protein
MSMGSGDQTALALLSRGARLARVLGRASAFGLVAAGIVHAAAWGACWLATLLAYHVAEPLFAPLGPAFFVVLEASQYTFPLTWAAATVVAATGWPPLAARAVASGVGALARLYGLRP